MPTLSKTKLHMAEPTMARLFAQLDDLIGASTRLDWITSLKKAYESAATNSLARVIAWNEWNVKRCTEGRRRDAWHDPKQPSRRYLSGEGRGHVYGETDLQRAQADLDYVKTLTVSFTLAHLDAEAELTSSIQAFCFKGAKKLHEVGMEEAERMDGLITYHEGINADVVFTARAGMKCRLTCRGKTNYRYGENSANGHLTVYSQYPFRVTWA